MLVGRLFGYFRERNQELNSAHFPGAEDDPWRPYRTLIKELQRGASTVVDLGAGPLDAAREWLEVGPSHLSHAVVIGIDRDGRALQRNPGKYRVVADGGQLPFRNGSVDLVLSRYALEHIRNPEATIQEIARVLKPQKSLVFVTPHRWCYVSVASRFTPMWFHRLIYRFLGSSAENLPYCPTYYRMNTPRKIRLQAEKAGLAVSQLRVTVGPPEYTKFLPPFLHRLFVRFHALLERSPRLCQYLGVNLFGVLQKHSPETSPSSQRPA
jgi:ubiquinone/menaquinone biosynthesis C-methylase UbiE